MSNLVWRSTPLGFRTECGRYTVRLLDGEIRGRAFNTAADDVPVAIGPVCPDLEAGRRWCEMFEDMAATFEGFDADPAVVVAAGVNGESRVVGADECPEF